MNGRDALEFIMAGATAVEIGTANFIDPAAPQHIAEKITEYLIRHNIKSISDICGII